MAQAPTHPAFIENTVSINAPASRVWQALTDPVFTRQYMFGCDVVSSWEVGDPVSWKGNEDGVTYVDGKLVQFEADKILEYTVFDPNASYAKNPADHLLVKYTISPGPGVSQLHVRQGDFTAVADGEKRYQDTAADGGWQNDIGQDQRNSGKLN